MQMEFIWNNTGKYYEMRLPGSRRLVIERKRNEGPGYGYSAELTEKRSRTAPTTHIFGICFDTNSGEISFEGDEGELLKYEQRLRRGDGLSSRYRETVGTMLDALHD